MGLCSMIMELFSEGVRSQKKNKIKSQTECQRKNQPPFIRKRCIQTPAGSGNYSSGEFSLPKVR